MKILLIIPIALILYWLIFLIVYHVALLIQFLLDAPLNCKNVEDYKAYFMEEWCNIFFLTFSILWPIGIFVIGAYFLFTIFSSKCRKIINKIIRKRRRFETT